MASSSVVEIKEWQPMTVCIKPGFLMQNVYAWYAHKAVDEREWMLELWGPAELTEKLRIDQENVNALWNSRSHAEEKTNGVYKMMFTGAFNTHHRAWGAHTLLLREEHDPDDLTKQPACYLQMYLGYEKRLVQVPYETHQKLFNSLK